jgi:hypothetical protein
VRIYRQLHQQVEHRRRQGQKRPRRGYAPVYPPRLEVPGTVTMSPPMGGHPGVYYQTYHRPRSRSAILTNTYGIVQVPQLPTTAPPPRARGATRPLQYPIIRRRGPLGQTTFPRKRRKRLPPV